MKHRPLLILLLLIALIVPAVGYATASSGYTAPHSFTTETLPNGHVAYVPASVGRECSSQYDVNCVFHADQHPPATRNPGHSFLVRQFSANLICVMYYGTPSQDYCT